MNPLDKEKIKEELSQSLGVASLPEEQQNKIIKDASDAILERATKIVLSMVPQEKYTEIDALLEAQDYEQLGQKLNEFVPNLSEIIDKVVSDGVVEYRQLLIDSGVIQDTNQSMQNNAPENLSSLEKSAKLAHQESFVGNENQNSLDTNSVNAPEESYDDLTPEKAAQIPPVAPGVVEENLVVGADGEAKPADDPLLNPTTPDQPAY